MSGCNCAKQKRQTAKRPSASKNQPCQNASFVTCALPRFAFSKAPFFGELETSPFGLLQKIMTFFGSPFTKKMIVGPLPRHSTPWGFRGLRLAHNSGTSMKLSDKSVGSWGGNQSRLDSRPGRLEAN